MSIMVDAVSKANCQNWTVEAKKKFAKADDAGATTRVATAPAN
jgi:hypothetical protein